MSRNNVEMVPIDGFFYIRLYVLPVIFFMCALYWHSFLNIYCIFPHFNYQFLHFLAVNVALCVSVFHSDIFTCIATATLFCHYPCSYSSIAMTVSGNLEIATNSGSLLATTTLFTFRVITVTTSTTVTAIHNIPHFLTAISTSTTTPIQPSLTF